MSETELNRDDSLSPLCDYYKGRERETRDIEDETVRDSVRERESERERRRGNVCKKRDRAETGEIVRKCLLVLLSEVDGELNPGVHISAPVLVPRLLVQQGQAAAVQLHLARNLRANHVYRSTLH